MAKEEAGAKIKIEVDATDADRALGKLRGSLGEAEQATQKLSGASASATTAMSKTAQANTDAGRALAATAQQTAAATMGLGKFGGAAGQATSALTQFAGSAGILGASLGPAGVAIAAVTTALPFLIKALDDTGDAATETTGEVQAFTTALEDGARALDAWLNAIESRQRVLAGGGTLAETIVAMQETERDIELATRALNQAMEAGDDRSIIELSRRLEELAARRDTLAAAEAPRELGGGSDRPERPSRGRGGPEEPSLDDLMARAQGGFQGQVAGMAGGGDDLDFLDEMVEAHAEATQSLKDTEDALHAHRMDQLAALDAREDELQRAREANLVKLNKRVDEFGKVGAEAGQLVWDIMTEGPERALASFLEATAQRNVISALEELAKAAGSYPDVVGIEQHLQAALLHGAVAAAAGGGAAAIGAGASSARPSSFDGGGGASNDNGSDGGTTVINFNSVVPLDQIGLAQRRADQAATRRHGSVRR